MSQRQTQKEEALVRMLRFVLGSNPAELALVPDRNGWLPVKELLAALHGDEGWRHVRETMLNDAVTRLAPDLFELDAKRIRCRERSYPPADYGARPPAHLYFGARRKAYAVIRQRGLEARHDGRPQILTSDQATALKLGKRRDSEPVPITVQANQAAEMGAVFAAWGEDGLFICDWCPADCLMGPPLPEKPLEKKPAKKKAPPQEHSRSPQDSHPGSFVVSLEDVEKPYKQKGLRKEISWKNQRRKDRRQQQD